MKRIGMTETGFQRVAEVAKKRAAREADRTHILEPVRMVYASLEEIDRDFDRRDDGTAVHKQSHRIWQMCQADDGGFELIRAQTEEVEEAPGTDEVQEPGDGFASAYSKQSRRVAQADIPSEEGEEEEELGSKAQSPMGAPPPPPPPTTAGLRDIIKRPDRLAGLTRGSKVLVRVGTRAVMQGKLLSKSDKTFDVLLSNGATTRVAHKDVAPDSPPPSTPNAKKAIDDKAKQYWNAYWKEYGRELTKTNLPRAVTDHADPATPKGKQKAPTKGASLTSGSVVDIGNLWMANGSKLRSSIVRISTLGHTKMRVADPFGNTGVVPRKAIVAIRSPMEFAAVRKNGTQANRARMLQAASAALTWKQIISRYPKAARLINDARRDVSIGIRIGLVGGAVPVKSGPAYLGRIRAMKEFGIPIRANFNLKAVDEKGRQYYKAYWGDYGADLVKEVKRRIHADLINKSAGTAPRPVPSTKQMTSPTPKQDLTAKYMTSAITAHVRGVLARNSISGDYSVTDVRIAKHKKTPNWSMIAGVFTGTHTAGLKKTTATRTFQARVENGKVKAIGIK